MYIVYMSLLYMYNYAHTFYVPFSTACSSRPAECHCGLHNSHHHLPLRSVPSGSVVTSYDQVEWTSEECPDDVDEASTTITDGSTSYTIESLREGSSYTITVTATNSAGTGPSDSETAETEEDSE